MVPDFPEASPGYSGADGALKSKSQHPSERRQRRRAPMQWSLRLYRNRAGEAEETTTQNLSSGGFYCMSRMPRTTGEFLFCLLHVPSHEAPLGDRFLILECQVRVTRVEPAAVPGFWGVACSIENYRFISPREPLSL
jgi:PilZ domain